MAGCSAEGTLGGAEIVVPIHAGAPGGDAAALTGELAEVDGCLVIRVGDTVFLPVWPADTTSCSAGQLSWGNDPVSARIGDEVVVGGGEADPESLPELIGGSSAARAPCAPDMVWVVANM